MDNTEYLKEEFFNTLFEQQVKRYTNSRDKKNLDVSLICTNPALANHFGKLYKKYDIQHSYADYLTECSFWAYRAIQRFEIKDEGTWEEVIAGTDKANLGRLINNIKTTVDFEIYKFANADAKFTMGKVEEEGKDGHITLKMEVVSLDQLLDSDDSEASLLDILSDEHALWSNKEEEYSLSYFSEWFEEHKAEILTTSQLKLLEDLRMCRKVEGYTTNDVYEVTGVDSFRINTKLKKMAARVEKVWAKENPRNFKNRLEMQRDKELSIWYEVMGLVEESDSLNQTNYFMDLYETEKVANLVVDNLMGEDIITFNRAYKARDSHRIALPAKTLYRLVSAVDERIETLSQMDCQVTTGPLKTEKTPQVRHEVQPCVVYDTNGMFLRMEDGKPEKQTKTTILYVLPSGVKIPLKSKE